MFTNAIGGRQGWGERQSSGWPTAAVSHTAKFQIARCAGNGECSPNRGRKAAGKALDRISNQALWAQHSTRLGPRRPHVAGGGGLAAARCLNSAPCPAKPSTAGLADSICRARRERVRSAAVRFRFCAAKRRRTRCPNRQYSSCAGIGPRVQVSAIVAMTGHGPPAQGRG